MRHENNLLQHLILKPKRNFKIEVLNDLMTVDIRLLYTSVLKKVDHGKMVKEAGRDNSFNVILCQWHLTLYKARLWDY